jgi:hypothetical protein
MVNVELQSNWFRAIVLLMAVAILPACALVQPRLREPLSLATSLQELVPHSDRDHFVFIVQRAASGQRTVAAIQVEHVTALAAAGEFEVTLSEDGVAIGRVHLRNDGATLWLLCEDDLAHRVRLAYDPPLPYLELPLVEGERRATTTARVSGLAGGEPNGAALGPMEVTQVVQLSAAPPLRTRLGAYDRAVSLHTVRTMQAPEGIIELEASLVLVPGIGELRSDGGVTGAPPLHRELACAIIGGRSIGDCRNLEALLEESHHAGPADVQ